MKSIDDSSPTKTQLDLIMEYFRNNPRRDITHPEIVDWVVAEYKKRTGKVFRDPDRGIRILAQDGLLIKVSKGVYRYDPDFVAKRELKDFTPAQKEAIMRARCYDKKKEIIYDKFMLALGIVFLIAGVGSILLAWLFPGDFIEDPIGYISLYVFGVLLLIVGLGCSFVGITGGI
jgi:hypothetical protein